MPAAKSLLSGPAAAPGGADLQHWLDALAGGTCQQDEFVAEVLRREPADPEITWEVLAQLDQYFRRKRIDHETYVCLKARFQRHCLGTGTDGTMHRTPAHEQDWHGDPAFTTTPWVNPAEDEPELVEPAEDAQEDTGPPPEPVEASFHREVRVGDVLCERYRVVDILQKEDWTTFVEAIDESKVDLPGIRQRVMLQLVDESRSGDPLLVQRVGKLQGLSHPSITRVLDVGEDCGVLVVVQEFFSGVTARELLERREPGVAFQPATGVVRSLAAALSHAHARGVAHGDLHPGNVLITELGDVRLQGFELRAQHHAVQPAADRLAFARLACQLFTGAPAPAPHARVTILSARRRPSCVSRSQWRALRSTLEGHGERSGADVLAAFGGALPADEPLRSGPAAGATPPLKRRRSHAGEWIAAGIVAAILGTGVYLYVDARRQGLETRPAAIVAATDAPASSPQQALAVQQTAPAGTADRIDTTVVTIDADTLPTAPAVVPARPQPPPAVRPETASTARPSIDLAASFAWVDTSARVARIWVMRRGNVNREVSFRWWTETGTAEVDRDFRRIDPRVEIIPYGARGIELLVPLMPDPARREPRTFYVKIDEPGPGTDLGPRTLMQVAIVPPGYPAARDTTALN